MLTRDLFDECFTWLVKTLTNEKDRPTPAMRETWWLKLQSDYDDDLLQAATNAAVCKLRPGKFPSIELMGKFLITEKEAARVREIEEKKKAEPKHPLSRPDYRNTVWGKEFLQRINSEVLAAPQGQGSAAAEKLIADMAAKRQMFA